VCGTARIYWRIRSHRGQRLVQTRLEALTFSGQIGPQHIEHTINLLDVIGHREEV
jgi:hypothetical protein